MRNEDIYHYESLNEMAFNFPEMSKREIEAQAAHNAAQMMEQGEANEWQTLAAAERLKAYAESFIKVIRNSITGTPEKNYKAHGCEFSMMITGDRLDFEQDDLYNSIKEQLKEREDLLKLAYKSTQPIYDADGVQVPKVGIKTHGSEVLKIKF